MLSGLFVIVLLGIPWELCSNNRSSEGSDGAVARSDLCYVTWAPEHLFSFIPRYVWDEQILPRRVQTVCLLQLSPHICFILIAILFSFLPAFLLFYIWLISIIFCLFLFCLSLLFPPCYPTLFSLPVITVMFASNASRLCTETHARTT